MSTKRERIDHRIHFQLGKASTRDANFSAHDRVWAFIDVSRLIRAQFWEEMTDEQKEKFCARYSV